MMMTTTMMRMTTDLLVQPVQPPVQPVQPPVQPVQLPVHPVQLPVHRAHLQRRLRSKKMPRKNSKPPLTRTAQSGGKTKTGPGGSVIPARKSGKSTQNEVVVL
jgi:hypothetical protein